MPVARSAKRVDSYDWIYGSPEQSGYEAHLFLSNR